MKVQISVHQYIKCSPEHVFSVLRNWNRYSTWWPVRVSVDTSDSDSFTVHPIPYVRIKIARDTEIIGRKIVYKYIAGPFRGEGIWFIENDPTTPGVTKVSYIIRLSPINKFFGIVSSTWFFRAKHCYDIRRIIGRICKVDPS